MTYAFPPVLEESACKGLNLDLDIETLLAPHIDEIPDAVINRVEEIVPCIAEVFKLGNSDRLLRGELHNLQVVMQQEVDKAHRTLNSDA